MSDEKRSLIDLVSSLPSPDVLVEQFSKAAKTKTYKGFIHRLSINEIDPDDGSVRSNVFVVDLGPAPDDTVPLIVFQNDKNQSMLLLLAIARANHIEVTAQTQSVLGIRHIVALEY